MQIMIFFDTNKYFYIKIMIFNKLNTYFSTTITFFTRPIIDFFTTIAHLFSISVNFSVMTVYYHFDNSQNPDTIDKKQISFVQANTPIPSPSGTFASPHEPTLQPKACKRACQPIPPNRTLQGQFFD